jgi:BASS family bile acid:Na+ symporter
MGHPILRYFVSLTIFTLMLALGVNHSFEQLTSLWRRPDYCSAPFSRWSC